MPKRPKHISTRRHFSRRPTARLPTGSGGGDPKWAGLGGFHVVRGRGSQVNTFEQVWVEVPTCVGLGTRLKTQPSRKLYLRVVKIGTEIFKKFWLSLMNKFADWSPNYHKNSQNISPNILHLFIQRWSSDVGICMLVHKMMSLINKINWLAA